MNTLGSQLVSELGRRRQLVMYFDYPTYRRLRQVDNLTDLARLVNAQGYECHHEPRDVRAVADALEAYANDLDGRPAIWAILLSDPTGVLGLFYLPIWALGRLFCRS